MLALNPTPVPQRLIQKHRGISRSVKMLVAIVGSVVLLAIYTMMTITGIGAPWTSTITNPSYFIILSVLCDPSVWILDIIPVFITCSFVWVLHQGTLKQLLFKFVKYITFLYLAMWLAWDMTWIAISAVAKPGTFWSMYGIEYFSIIIPNTPLWLFVVVAIAGFLMAILLIITTRRNPRRLIPFILYLIFVYLPGGIDQMMPLPLFIFEFWDVAMISAIILTFALTGIHRPGPMHPSPAFVKFMIIDGAIILSAIGYCVFEFMYHWNDPTLPFSEESWKLWLVYLEMLVPWVALTGYNLGHRNKPVVIVVRANVFEIQYVQHGIRQRIKGWNAVIIAMLLCTALDELVSIVANAAKGLNFQLTALEKMLYYVFSGVAEESLFRIGLITIILAIIYTISKTARKSKAPVVIAAIISGLVWSLMHWSVYGPGGVEENIPMMFGLFVAGIIMGLFYGFTRSPLVVIGCHMLINLFASQFGFAMLLAVLI